MAPPDSPNCDITPVQRIRDLDRTCEELVERAKFDGCRRQSGAHGRA